MVASRGQAEVKWRHRSAAWESYNPSWERASGVGEETRIRGFTAPALARFKLTGVLPPSRGWRRRPKPAPIVVRGRTSNGSRLQGALTATSGCGIERRAEGWIGERDTYECCKTGACTMPESPRDARHRLRVRVTRGKELARGVTGAAITARAGPPLLRPSAPAHASGPGVRARGTATDYADGTARRAPPSACKPGSAPWADSVRSLRAFSQGKVADPSGRG
jgi:hypothetical protein